MLIRACALTYRNTLVLAPSLRSYLQRSSKSRDSKADFLLCDTIITPSLVDLRSTTRSNHSAGLLSKNGRLLPIKLFTDLPGFRRGVPARRISPRAHVRLRARIGALGAALVFDARAPAEGMISRLQRRHIHGLKQGRLARAMPRALVAQYLLCGLCTHGTRSKAGLHPPAPLRLLPERD